MKINLIVLLSVLVLSACTMPNSAPPTPTVTLPVTVAPTLAPSVTPIPITAVPATFTAIPTVIPTTTVPVNLDICTDPQVKTLLDSFKTAILTSNGSLLSLLVSPMHGMDTRYFRDGKVVNYDQEHAKFLFETTYQVNWGIAPGSGLDIKGSFHEVVLPDLLKVFDKSYSLHCNQLKYGGVTYQPVWPYKGGFYSAYFPGTDPNGGLDWHTWVVGVEYVAGKPYIYSIMQFFWEP